MPRPYGPVGLILSLGVILLLTAAVFAAPFAAAALVDLAVDRGAGTRAALDLLRASVSGAGDASWQGPLFLVGCWFYAALAAATLAAAVRRGRAGWRDLVAWTPWTPWRAGRFYWGLVCAGLIYGLAASWAISLVDPAVDDLAAFPRRGLPLLATYLLVAVAAPLAEELLFRGWIFTSLRARLAFWPANLVAAAVFALAHWEHTHLYALGVFPIGLMLGAVRERTGSVRASATFHALYNFGALTLAIAGSS